MGPLRLLLVLSLVAAALAAGCGEEERPARKGPDPEHAREVARNPHALTSGDVARQPENSTSQRLVINAEFDLGQEPALQKRVAEMTLNRVGRSVYWAISEICKGRDASFTPGRLAVEEVRKGNYLVQPRPESWSDPERWSGQQR